MSSDYTLLEKTLKDHGLSVTMPRKAVFDALATHEPQDMSSLTKELSSSIDRASIYRTIDLFEKLGIVQRLQFGWKYKLELTDVFHLHHHHFTCQRCGTMFAIEEDHELESKIEELARSAGFTPLSHQVEISGLCKKCS